MRSPATRWRDSACLVASAARENSVVKTSAYRTPSWRYAEIESNRVAFAILHQPRRDGACYRLLPRPSSTCDRPTSRANPSRSRSSFSRTMSIDTSTPIPSCYDLQCFDDSTERRPCPYENSVRDACLLQSGQFIVPVITHCDLISESSLEPGARAVLFV